jgi:uncharacterized repeat protein (TIGR01451 family)
MTLITIHSTASPPTNFFSLKSRGRHVSALALLSSLALVCFLGAGPMVRGAWAADGEVAANNKVPIVVKLKQFKVVKDAKGEPKLMDASLVLPGDVIEYQATYSNRGLTPLSVTATLPVPESVEYVKESAKSSTSLPHTVALKDSQFAQEPLVRRVTETGGAAVTQQVPYAQYRFVRWDLGKLMPGASIEVSIRAQVAQNLEGEIVTGK